MQRIDPQKFIQNGYALVPMKVAALVRRVFAGLHRFLAEPQEYKNQWTFDHKKPGDPDTGYVWREGGEYDKKQFFHYRPDLVAKLTDRISRKFKFNHHAEWLQDCELLFRRAEQQVGFIAGILTHHTAFAGHTLPELLRAAKDDHVLRLLAYDRVDDGGLMAKPHADRDFLTLHLADTFPGLVGIVRNKEVLLETRATRAIIFPGSKMAKLTEGKVPALIHKVIERREKELGHSPEQRKNGGVPKPCRNSAVFFSHINLDL